ncbi:MAG: hypothetical protein COA86_05230 [Kangiella sp.]|nr:MAG: hypothetical protein COA86_05230 [Kangiella sp.]
MLIKKHLSLFSQNKNKTIFSKCWTFLFLNIFYVFSYQANAALTLPCDDTMNVNLISKQSSEISPSASGCNDPLPPSPSPGLTLPSTPAWIQVPASDNDGTFAVTWAYTSDAYEYRLERKLSNESTFTFIAKTTLTKYTNNAIPDGTYSFRV